MSETLLVIHGYPIDLGLDPLSFLNAVEEGWGEDYAREHCDILGLLMEEGAYLEIDGYRVES